MTDIKLNGNCLESRDKGLFQAITNMRTFLKKAGIPFPTQGMFLTVDADDSAISLVKVRRLFPTDVSRATFAIKSK